MKAPPVPQKEGPRTNREIRAREVQLIDAEGQNRGVVQLLDALALAEEAGVDLVEIVPNATPPVCKILDYGKFRFLEQKKAAEARKKQKIVEIKEIKLRPGIDDHDYDVKMRAMRRFFEEGDKVKVTLRFRGREMAHQDIGYRSAAAREGRNVDHRQGRGRPVDGRPPDDHGAGAALIRASCRRFAVLKPLPRQGLFTYKPPFDPPGQ
jgi:translation initiation factor IF-3